MKNELGIKNIDLQLFARDKPKVPTAKHIHIRIKHEGKSREVAAVQSFRRNVNKETKPINSFGEEDSIGTVSGNKETEFNITRVEMLDSAYNDGIVFEDLNDFEVVVEYPDRDRVYKNCNWSSISEDIELGEPIQTDVDVIAGKSETVPK